MIKYTVSPDNTSEQNRFVSISDFKTCMKWHGEVEFMWTKIYIALRLAATEESVFPWHTAKILKNSVIPPMKFLNIWLALTACVM